MVEQEFEQDPESGDWHRKGEETVGADQESEGFLDRVKTLFSF
jgi:hypothetical protein